MPRSRSSSPHRQRDARDRSRSPRYRDRDHRDKPKKGSGGFRWKEKQSRDVDEHTDRRERGGLERGYRERDRNSDRRDRDSYRDRPRSPERHRDDEEIREPAPPMSAPKPVGDDEREKAEKAKRKQERKEKKAAALAATQEPMIIVSVNDRLGTKAAIPCLASDPIKLFKAQVAARIGREPHEIMLKRQGERPFKDHLTLEDYGVSNGVQLDLEMDTGD
ncbi:hypothetical protein MMC25_006033 [Agyrium rufum]|nr:hypothetical protein [Agyrium rufum]